MGHTAMSLADLCRPPQCRVEVGSPTCPPATLSIKCTCCAGGRGSGLPRAVYRSNGVSCSLLVALSASLYQNRSRHQAALGEAAGSSTGSMPGQDENQVV